MLRYAVATFIFFFASVAPSSADVHKTAFSERVSRICAGALLFRDKHEIGTRAGALAVSRDIRETGNRRLHRVAAIPEPSSETTTIQRWLDVERTLVAAYAHDYVLIWDAIENADTSTEMAKLPVKVHALVHATDPLKRRADSYLQQLEVPDCTGGGT